MLFVVTLRGPGSEDFIVDALKGGFTSRLLTIPMQMGKELELSVDILHPQKATSDLDTCGPARASRENP